MIAPKRNTTKWVVLLIVIMGALIMGIVLPNQLIDNPGASGSLEPGAFETPQTINRISTNLPQEPLQTSVFIVNGTAVLTPEKNCTYSAIYWVNHQENWPYQVIIFDLNYTKEDAARWIETDRVDVFTLLFTQFHVAYLNIISGAEASGVNQAMIEASRWLTNHPAGSLLVEADGLYGMDLAAYLARFNDGRIGPGKCADEPAADSYGKNGFLAPVLSVTPSASGLFNPVTATAEFSLTPTSQRATRTATRFPGSASPTSTIRSTSGAGAPVATATQPPPPTATRPPPPTATQPPPPTATQPPPPTPVPTQEPPPTMPPTEDPPPTAPPG